MIEEAAAYQSDAQPEALFALLLLYNREKRYEDALRTVGQLQDRYPRNRLLLLEEASTALRAGKVGRASQALDRGFNALSAETRPLAGGERTIWHAVRGATRLRLGQAEAAIQDLRVAERDAAAPAWLKGRTQLGLGKSADLGGDRTVAVGHYQRAVRLCEAGRDQICADEASRLGKSAYRGGQ
jgi:tetratricopeptide (TPR) repeat protein